MTTSSASQIVLEFAGHAGLGVSGFLVICAAAIILELSTRYIDNRRLLPAFCVLCIQCLAYGQFLVDLISFVCFIAVVTWNFLGEIRDLIHGRPTHRPAFAPRPTGEAHRSPAAERSHNSKYAIP
jgi:hypothetical protein